MNHLLWNGWMKEDTFETILDQQHEKKDHVIYYANNILNRLNNNKERNRPI